MLEYYWWKAINVRYINVHVLHKTWNHTYTHKNTSHLVHIVRVTNISEYTFSPIKLWNPIAILFIHERFHLAWFYGLVRFFLQTRISWKWEQKREKPEPEQMQPNWDELYEFDPFFSRQFQCQHTHTPIYSDCF